MLKLFRLIKPYRGYVALVLVLALAQSIGFLLLPRLMSDIVDQGIVKGDQRAILQTGGLMLAMSVVATLCAIAGSFFSAKVATGFGRILRGAIFARVSHFSIHQFDRFSAASLVTRTTNDTTQVQQMLIMMLAIARAIVRKPDVYATPSSITVSLRGGRRGRSPCNAAPAGARNVLALSTVSRSAHG